MIIKMTWRKCTDAYKIKYTGYFLFGIIPLYLAREEE